MVLVGSAPGAEALGACLSPEKRVMAVMRGDPPIPLMIGDEIAVYDIRTDSMRAVRVTEDGHQDIPHREGMPDVVTLLHSRGWDLSEGLRALSGVR
jgi:hypothetical protein